MNSAELTAALIQIDSRNPSLAPGAPGEGQIAAFLVRLLERWAFRVNVQEVAPGRCNVIARAGEALSGWKSLMLNGHLDVVGVDGMAHDPFAPTISDGKLFGRGSADMKAGVASMCVAAREAAHAGLKGEIVIALVIDEEYESLGTRAVIAAGTRADAAVITEPTRLALCPAHRGFVWVRMDVHGRAAHGSRYDLGVDAITLAALVIAELDRVQRKTFAHRTHPLLGRASLHASTISGGSGLSTYPELCTVELERRTLPGETARTFLDELAAATAMVRNTYPDLSTDITLTTSQAPSDVSLQLPVVKELTKAMALERVPARIEGLSAWTDAALLNEAGIPTICFGPGDIALAHSATEYVPVSEIDAATRVLERFVGSWCNAKR
ncbi:MAG: ArgE/DapE family deacylase [Gemmatimonadota bacterium]|nr:ArgE/DapE family deacylase [Gemmatimonadota bacterium]